MSNKKGILMIMSNANGWRNSNVFGGAELKTVSMMNKINNMEWHIILPEQLYKIFINKYFSKQLSYYPIKTLFLETNVIKDILQGILYTLKCLSIGWKNRKKIDLIYSATTNFSDIFPAKLISVLTRRPYIVKYHISIYDEPNILRIFHNFREEKNSFLDSLIRAVLARVTIIFLKKAEKNLVVCHYLGEQLEKCGVDKEKIEINYNGLDFDEMEKFRVLDAEKKYDLCYIGRIEKNKGLQDAIEAIKILKVKKPDISMVIIGDGSFMPELKDIINNAGLESNMEVKGFLGDERYRILQQSKIFISPTYAKEGFGLTLLEAIFFGTPIIAYTHPVFKEIFNKYASVFLIEKNIDDLAEKIDNVLKINFDSNREQLEQFSLNAFARREKDIIDNIFVKL